MGEWHNLCSSETCISAFFFRYLAISKLLTTLWSSGRREKAFGTMSNSSLKTGRKEQEASGQTFALKSIASHSKSILSYRLCLCWHCHQTYPRDDYVSSHGKSTSKKKSGMYRSMELKLCQYFAAFQMLPQDRRSISPWYRDTSSLCSGSLSCDTTI